MLTDKYRTRPVEVEISEPLTPENREMVRMWVRSHDIRVELPPPGYEVALVIHTDSGEHDCLYGWRVVKGTVGEFHPLDPRVFETMYEPA